MHVPISFHDSPYKKHTSPNHPWKSCGPKEMAHTTRRLGSLPRSHDGIYSKHGVGRCRDERGQHNKSNPRGGRVGYTQVIRENISSAVLEEQHGNQDGQEQLQLQTEGIQTSYIAGQSGADASCIQRVYNTMYPCEEPILEPVDLRV